MVLQAPNPTKFHSKSDNLRFKLTMVGHILNFPIDSFIAVYDQLFGKKCSGPMWLKFDALASPTPQRSLAFKAKLERLLSCYIGHQKVNTAQNDGNFAHGT